MSIRIASHMSFIFMHAGMFIATLWCLCTAACQLLLHLFPACLCLDSLSVMNSSGLGLCAYLVLVYFEKDALPPILHCHYIFPKC